MELRGRGWLRRALPQGAARRLGLVRDPGGVGRGLLGGGHRLVGLRRGRRRWWWDRRGDVPVAGPVPVAAQAAEHLTRLPERLGELARDDEDLVRVALRELRQHLEVLVGQQALVGAAAVDRREDGLDRLRLALGAQDRRLLRTLGPQDRRLLLALR